MPINRTYSLRTLKALWGRSGNRCAFPDCRQLLVRDLSSPQRFAVVGEMAHIVAVSSLGPRGQPSNVGVDELANLILLCPTHHRLIDSAPTDYPPDELLAWKRQHELAVLRAGLRQVGS